MKNVIILLSFLSIFSCKKAQENISKQSVSNEILIDKNWNGDPVISDLSFANSINASCKLNTAFFNRSKKQIKEDDTKCALSKIKFSYDKLNSINEKIVIGKLSSGIQLFIKNSSPLSVNDADLSYQATLYIEKNKTILDSIIIYQYFNYSEALTVKTKYYNINEDNIYLLDLVQDESGANSEKWEHFKLNTSGKISLVKQKIFPKENNTVANHDNKFWEGTYNFQASNKDDSKTIFDITIHSLKDVSVNITEEGIVNKYSHLEAEEINNGKIKIAYDNSSDDMGVIYIEKSDGNYTISGNPIYFINPGSNEILFSFNRTCYFFL